MYGSMYLVFNSVHCISSDYPKICIGDTICNFFNEVKYLGVMISSSMKTTIDFKKQSLTFYTRANLLIRNFRHCTDKVKCYLFQSYCTSTYCSQLWFNSTKDSLCKLRKSYNTVLGRLLCIYYHTVPVKCLYLEEF